MKTTVKQLAAVTFLAILVIIVNFNAEATEDKNSTTKTAITFEVIEETETALEMESWMTETETWNLNFSTVEETETVLELESWMTTHEVWDINNVWAVETESELQIKDWMTSETVWDLK